ncbi:hypothetical protein [Breznakia pachnodae]|uniref:Uncharacterized protein n=1 Tax=Breznakia pachnodae TaxID=265178 RepID=A0ABU0E6K3_9FIRM|nr:hypothetical protein [Breznakia pachnodae]MDQ0362512.1 hypothetical protein [Breznakia pachnodae]
MKREILLEEGRISSLAIDKTTNTRVKVKEADFERHVVTIIDGDGKTDLRFFSEIQCIQIVDDETIEPMNTGAYRSLKYEELKKGLKVFDKRYGIWRTVHKTWIKEKYKMVQFRSDENKGYAVAQLYCDDRFYIKEKDDE